MVHSSTLDILFISNINDLIERRGIVYHTAEPLIENPRYKEIKNIMKCVKNRKAPGSDGITPELLKYGGVYIWSDNTCMEGKENPKGMSICNYTDST